MEKEKKKAPRKYAAIAKIGYNPALKQPICVKYRFNNIEKFIEFMRSKYPLICWINIYAKDIDAGTKRGLLLYTWGNKKGLQNATK